MLPVGDLAGWLLDRSGWPDGVPLVKGPYLPTKPDRCVILTSTPAPGPVGEWVQEVIGFQFRTRGSSGATADGYDDAEALARAVDAIVLAEPKPVHTIGGRACSLVTGGPPAMLVRDTAGRHHFVATYLFTIAR